MNANLYEDPIMNHARSGVGSGRLDAPDASVTLDNPLCGDRITLDVTLDGDRVSAVGHHVRGCALCQAAAAVMAAAAVGENQGDAEAARTALATMLEGGTAPDGPWAELAVFEPVRGHKSRHECVLLPLEALAKVTAGTSAED
ncbi:MAG: iron-sulfur cluster assembly scaffold protein [Alphaproteobacteria bacterium]|jgi:nitrogen fixation NifU-like protein|nr:iron-sulfur cluster assembly scaffold protein [Alphaproteobacteria bacterium]HJP23489.1 iron-sulfur cluster assembly scaffold protein [Alphaproteobacteria bacterium]